MSPDLIERLIRDHPDFFPPARSPAGRLSREIDCGDGWYFLIDALFGLIRWKVITSPGGRMHQPVLSRIHSDRGVLKVRFRRTTQPVQWVVDMIECLGMSTCEVCGVRGAEQVHGHGELRVRCRQHEHGAPHPSPSTAGNTAGV